MTQWIIKLWVRLGLLFYCKNIFIYRKKKSPHKTATILACNHPNSFLDALIIGSHYPGEIFFLARGDVFNKRWVANILRGLNMIPVYRISEGKENLALNDVTFKKCLDVLKKHHTLLIFSEGICINEWKVRTLKKGTARIAYQAWYVEDLQVTVEPLGISYNTFSQLPKNVWINRGDPIVKNDFIKEEVAGFLVKFNILLKGKLEGLIRKKDDTYISAQRNIIQKYLLAIPAFAGWLTQKWFFNFLKGIAKRKTKNTVFFDSVLFGLLLITYPFFILIICSLCYFLFKLCWAVAILLPFTAWCYKEWKSF